jgi:4-hydroxy-tetrahydrodipicolinate synthase
MTIDELKGRMKGIAVVQTTPFNKDGSLDLDGLRENTRWLADYAKGRDFILIPLGSTGEFYAMTDDERKSAVEAVAEVTEGRAVVLAGAGAAGTRLGVDLCQHAQSAGADGVQVVLPFYHIPQEEGMYLHYKNIAESVNPDFGIMVYNNPTVSGSWINPPLMKRLSKIPNIIAVKENSVDIFLFSTMMNEVNPDDAVILTGSGEIAGTYFSVFGCPGFISFIANFTPEIAQSVYEAIASRDFETAVHICKTRVEPFDIFVGKLQEKYGPHTGTTRTWGGVEGFMYLAAVKAAMDLVGLRGGEVRLPLIGLDNEDKAELKDVLKEMSVL